MNVLLRNRFTAGILTSGCLDRHVRDGTFRSKRDCSISQATEPVHVRRRVQRRRHRHVDDGCAARRQTRLENAELRRPEATSLLPGATYTRRRARAWSVDNPGDASAGRLRVETSSGTEIAEVQCSPNTYDASPNLYKWSCSLTFKAPDPPDVATVRVDVKMSAWGGTNSSTSTTSCSPRRHAAAVHRPLDRLIFGAARRHAEAVVADARRQPGRPQPRCLPELQGRHPRAHVCDGPLHGEERGGPRARRASHRLLYNNLNSLVQRPVRRADNSAEPKPDPVLL